MISYDTISLIFVCLIVYVYIRLKKAFSYFEENGIPYIKPNSWIFGNVKSVFWHGKSLGFELQEFYRELTPHRFGGIFQFQKPTFIIRDVELVKNILNKDFEYFQHRSSPPPNDADPLSYNLFSLRGEEWKNLRMKYTSAFTPSKMKMMLPLVDECAQRMHKILSNLSGECFDFKDLTTRYTTDAVGSCAFGLETSSLEKLDNEFRKMSKHIFKIKRRSLILKIWPSIPKKLMKLFNLTFLDVKLQDYFKKIVEETVIYREENNVQRKDFLDILIAMKNNTLKKCNDDGDKEDLEKILAQVGGKVVESNLEMIPNVLVAQCIILFLAGFSAASSSLSFLFLELAQNHEIQDKVRDEILSLLNIHDDQVTYEMLNQMTYTDMVIDEIHRKYPETAVINRMCTKDYKIPNSNVVIPANTPVYISQLGIHNDEKYYEKPDKFYPEHFTAEGKANRPSRAYIPFGDGPRVCIGERFAKMQIKVGLIYLLKDSIYRVSPKMKLPVVFENNSVVLAAEGGIWLQRVKYE